MFRLRYHHPISNSIVTRYFKSINSIKRHIENYNCYISFSVCDDFGDDYFFSYDVKNNCYYGSFAYFEFDNNGADYELD